VRAEDGGKARIPLPHITYTQNIISITAPAFIGEKSVCFFLFVVIIDTAIDLNTFYAKCRIHVLIK